MQSPKSLSALNGVRALLNLAVVASHVCFKYMFVSDRQLRSHIFHNEDWFRAGFMLAFVAMDAFIILTGFLAAWRLIPALQNARGYDQSDQAIFSYYKSRFLRIVPPYYIFLGVITFIGSPLFSFILPSLTPEAQQLVVHWLTPSSCSLPVRASDWFFLSNLSGCNGCFRWFWNLSVQMQFYLLFPWILIFLARPARPHFRERLSELCVLAGLFSLGWRFFIIWEQNISIPLIEHALPDVETFELAPQAESYKTLIHGSLNARVFELALGCWLAMKVRSSVDRSALETDRSKQRSNTAAPPTPARKIPHTVITDITDMPDEDTAIPANASQQAQALSSQKEKASPAAPKRPFLKLASIVALLLTALQIALLFGKLPEDPNAENFPIVSFIILGAVMGIVQPGIIAYQIYYITTCPDFFAETVSALLSCKPLSVLARFSYGTYIVHIHVISLLMIMFPVNYFILGQNRTAQKLNGAFDGTAFHGLPAYLLFFVTAYGLSFLIGAGLEKVASRLCGGGKREVETQSSSSETKKQL